MRNTRAVALALLCIAQNVAARPDFGMKGDVVGKTEVVSSISLTTLTISNLEYKIELGSQYQPLYDERDTLYMIAQKITDTGTAMAESVSYLAADSSGFVEFSYQSALTAIDNVLTLIRTELTQELPKLQVRGKLFITNMLIDNFNYIAQIMVSLEELLRIIKPMAQNAQTSVGGIGFSVPAETIRHFISPRLINKLLNVIVLLPNAFSPILYSVHNPLAQIDQADTYISTAKGAIEEALQQARVEVVNFNGNFRTLRQETIDVITNVEPVYNDQQTAFSDLLPTLQAATTFKTNLKGALESYSSTFSFASVEEKIVLLQQTVENYIAKSKTFDDDLGDVYGDRICPVMRSLVQVLVASGPYASYCYEKYAKQVVDLAVHNYYDVGECYALELNRMYATNRLITDLVEMVMFNVDELFENLNTCFENHTCPGSCDGCVDTLGRFLNALAKLTKEKFDMVLQIVPYEASASLQRLKSCVAFSKYKLIADAHDLVINIFKCEDTGYRK